MTDLKGTIGFELECGVPIEVHENLKRNCNRRMFVVSDDGSLRVPDNQINTELKSPVYAIKNDHKKLSNDLRAICKYISPVNESMGFHVHVKPNCIGLQQALTEKPNVDKFCELYLEKFKSKLERERSSNRYCRFSQEISAENWNYHYWSEKYLAVNSNNAFRNHKTVEFRVFPSSNKPSKLLSYIGFTLKYLDDLKAKLQEPSEEITIRRRALVPEALKKKIEVKGNEKGEDNGCLSCPVCGGGI